MGRNRTIDGMDPMDVARDELIRRDEKESPMSVAMIEVTVMTPTVFKLPYHHVDVVKHLCRVDLYVEAIRFLRAEYVDLSLKGAKDLCDAIRVRS